MASSFRMFGNLSIVFYVVIPLAAITTLYTILFRLDRPPRSQDLALPPLLSSSDSISGYASSLAAICDETDWTEGLWLQCHSNVGPSKMAMRGGLSNLQNRMQTCTRLAISAGAGVILPTFATRSGDDLFKYPIEKCPESLFDTELYRDALHLMCPQLSIRACNDTAGLDTTIEASFRKYLDPSHSNGTFRTLIDDTIAESGVITRPEISAEKPVRITYGDPFLAWNYTAAADTEAKKDLFKMLGYNEKLSGLGKQVFDELRNKSSAPVVGIHLRGEEDWPRSFGRLDIQIDIYTEALLELRSKTLNVDDTATIKDVYVSCGNPKAIRKFEARIGPLGYIVHDKISLLSNRTDILEEIEALQFDEKAITEYESLVSADYFMGILTSSLSTIVAYTRTVNEEGDYFDKYIHPGTTRAAFVDRVFPDSPSIRGNEHTKLMVLTGPDIMDCFP